jgi:zinc protease
MMRWLCAGMTLVCLFFMSHEAAAEGSTLPPAKAPQVREIHLQNGLRVRVEAGRSSGLVAVVLSYKAGHKDRPVGRRGLPHLVEHLAMRASAHVARGADALSDVGGQVNAFTKYEATTYVALVPRGYLERALWIESDRMGFLQEALTEANLRAEQKIVQQEWISRSGDARGGMVGKLILNELFPAGDARHDALDTPKEVAAITLADVRQFVGAYYHPNNASLAIVGDLDVDEVIASVRRYFDDLPKSAEPLAASAPAPVAFTGQMTLTTVSNSEQPKLTVVYSVPTPMSVGDAAVSRVLARKLESVLRAELVTKRLWAKGVQAELTDIGGSWFMMLSVVLRGNVRSSVVEHAVDSVIGFLQTGDYDVDEARRSVAVSRTRRHAEALDRAVDLAEQNSVTSLEMELAALERVTAKQVRKYATERLPASRRLILREKAAAEARRVGALYEKEGRLFGGRSQ